MQKEFNAGDKVALVDYEHFFTTIKDAKYIIATIKDVKKCKSRYKDDDIFVTLSCDVITSKFASKRNFGFDLSQEDGIISFYLGAGPSANGYEIMSLSDLYGYMERIGHELIDEGNFLLSHKEEFKKKYSLDG